MMIGSRTSWRNDWLSQLTPVKLTALAYSPAQDVNGFVVTKATADKYKLVKLSDLAKPAP